MRRTFWGALLFWVFLAPGLLYAFLAVTTIPAILARAVLGPSAKSPVGQFAMFILGLAMAASTIALVWWVWRLYRGDPPREPKIPSERVLVAVAVVILAWTIAIQFVESRGNSTVVDLPWLLEPVYIDYPDEVEVAGREAVVELSLLISASGEIERYEFTNAAPAEFQAEVAEAVERMRINTKELHAKSYPYEKRLRISFVRD